MKKALLVIDYQNDFVIGSLGNENAKAIENNVCDEIEKRLNENYDLYFTYDSHTEKDLKHREIQTESDMHCVCGTPGWNIYGKVNDYVKFAKRIIKKNSYGSLELAKILNEENYDEVMLIGVTAHVCVLSNALLACAALPNAKIVVDSNCIASSENADKEKAIYILKKHRVDVN